MDDLHPDSDDANVVKIPSDNSVSSDDTVDASDSPVTDDADAADEAASKESVAPDNGVTDQPAANKVDEADSALEADDAVAASQQPPSDGARSDDAADAADATDATDELTADAPEEAAADAVLDDTVPLPAVDIASKQSRSDFSTIRELGRDAWGRILLAWRGDAQASSGQEPPVVLLERTALDVETARRMTDFHLYHARLLAPRAVVQREGDTYWLVVEAPANYEAPFETIGDGGRLEVRSALKAGVGLANALSYLHTNGVAHGNVDPMAILVHDGRAYLSGVERCALVEAADETGVALYAADVNALGRALAMLVGLPDEADVDETAPAQALRAIAARADAAGYATAEELAQECGSALQEPALALPEPDESVTHALEFHCGTATTVGLLRTQNQDALGCTVLEIRDDIGRDQPLGIFLVADGMGGEAAGEIASRIGARIATAELLRQLLAPTVAMPALDPFSPGYTTGATSVATLAQALAVAVDAANRQVRALAATLQESTGTTLTAIVTAGRQAVLAHLGDSRAYLLRAGALVQLTKDHSLLARLTELDHPLLNDPSFGMPRNYLYRSLGQEDEAPPDMMEFPIAPGDRLLICSDGLWDELDDATIQRCLTSTDDPAECANHLVRLANASGGHDNSTAVVVFVEALRDDPATEFTPEQIDAILRASGALDEEGDDDDANGS
ncbi:MAG TPA: protein phosphatase 2C domain-containing protein [Ktedonobacterales bacterium]|nr:protein phosphatase 2C domain-containing protein [Ktedonobacterales bacterium]